MATYKVTRSGVTFNGQVYAEGDTFELDEGVEGDTQPRKHLFEKVRSGEYDGIELDKDAEQAKKAQAEREEAEAEVMAARQASVKSENVLKETSEGEKPKSASAPVEENKESNAKQSQKAEEKKDDK